MKVKIETISNLAKKSKLGNILQANCERDICVLFTIKKEIISSFEVWKVHMFILTCLASVQFAFL